MWPWAELDHGLVEVIFSANGSRTSLLSARVRRQAHYSSILPLQASGIICHNRVWHDRTTECIKILLASQASPLLPWEGSQGKNSRGVSLQACGHPDRQATGCLVHVTRGWPQCLLQSAISLLDLNPQGRLGNSSFSKKSPGYAQVLLRLELILIVFVCCGHTKGRKHGFSIWPILCPSTQLDWAW